MPRKRPRVAIIYDFDGTLAPGNMQEHQFIPKIGMKPAAFWAEVKRIAKKHNADPILMYMHVMLDKAHNAKIPVRKTDFEQHGQQINLFEGVEEWFSRINQYGKDEGARIEHYIVSSGNAEIIEGTPIACKFEQIYASRFLFDENGRAVWPAHAVNYTTKTQYLFRINKGAHDLSDEVKVNQFIKKEDRPIPFENMIYLGDGLTDVPCFRLVKDQGGTSIAVFPPRKKNARSKAEKLLEDGRVHCVVPADYREGTEIDRIVRANIRAIVSREQLGALLR